MDYDSPESYQQPIRDFIKRYLDGENENVDFVPKSNMRIWYNYQVEGYPLHKHSALEVVLPVENGYKYIADGRKFQLNIGDILFIPPNCLHEIECDTEGSRFIYLFEIGFLKNLFDYGEVEKFLSEPRLVNSNTYPDIHQKIRKLFLEISDIYFMHTTKICEMIIFSKLIEVFAVIAQETGTETAVHFANDKQRENFYKFKSLIDYINSHYMDNLSLEYAATFVGFSKFHFARLFKEFTDSSFYDYLTHRRIVAAKALLEDETLSITDVGERCGFTNQSTFTRCFSSHVNMTPSKYRQQLRQSKN